MGNKIYFSQIQAKIDRLQRERTQVLEHLELVERKIKKLQDALEVMEAEALTDEYNTELYTYRTYKHRFNGKLRQMVLAVLKAQPDHYFTVNELTEIILIKDGQELIIHPQHTVSVRGALKHWLKKDIVERLEINTIDVRWRLRIVSHLKCKE